MTAALRARRNYTKRRLDELDVELSRAGTPERVAERACVYLTGSFGRGEATEHSDVDLFIVGLGGGPERELPRLDEICAKADLIQSTRKLGFSDFSGDGEYLTHHGVDDLLAKLGAPDDDAANTLTARLLLLLESKPLVGNDVYWKVIEEVVAKYWRDYQDHKNDFVPAFLANDILRLWRTFCVNYEARTKGEPPEKKAKRKLKNYKLKHSRLLTCYSGLVFLLSIYLVRGTVSPGDAVEMVRRTPTERLEWLRDEARFRGSANGVDSILAAYDQFLAETEGAEETLVERFLDPKRARAYAQSASALGDRVSELLESLGAGNRMFRLLLV